MNGRVVAACCDLDIMGEAFLRYVSIFSFTFGAYPHLCSNYKCTKYLFYWKAPAFTEEQVLAAITNALNNCFAGKRRLSLKNRYLQQLQMHEIFVLLESADVY
jgi:hypothetical protein